MCRANCKSGTLISKRVGKIREIYGTLWNIRFFMDETSEKFKQVGSMVLP